jgi:feruloyl esterase
MDALFLVLGMDHCGGGPSLDRFDALVAMEQWVEHGVAQSSMLATGTAFPNRKRPLCAYPRHAHYRGRGSIELATSFKCKR